MKRVLFVDRDGTIIEEPVDQQIDSLEKLRFIPGVINNLRKLQRECGFSLVMVSNQDGLGTATFPEDTFWPAHNMMLEILRGEGVTFDEILIDRSLPEDDSPTRKPRTGLVEHYCNSQYDLKNSWVIGDRLTDVELAKNIGCKSIFLSKSEHESSADFTSDSWQVIYEKLALPARTTTITRKTSETDILVRLCLDGAGVATVSTGLRFFDHMLEQIAKHSGCNLEFICNGDLDIDEHHTIEDSALALGEAFRTALSDKLGVERYGFMLPMDDCLAQVGLDFSGRPWLVWEVEFKREKVGDMPTEMFMHFFKSFSDAAQCNLFIRAEGRNEHHKIEAIFKALARSIKQAIRRDPERMLLPTTKGVL